MKQILLPSTPREVVIAITGRCNLACRHCHYAEEMVSLNDLDTTAWMDFFEELEANRVMRVKLTGGEPFIREDIFRLIEGIIRHRMRFSLTTNATLISADTVEQLQPVARRLDDIQVSMEGSSGEIHDRLRGEGSYELAIKGLKALISAELPVSVRITVTQLNIDDLFNTCRGLIELGVKSINIDECLPFGEGEKNAADLLLTPEQFARTMDILANFSQTYPGILQCRSGFFVIHSCLKAAEKLVPVGRGSTADGRGGHLSECGAALKIISVLHDGQYVPCLLLPQLHLGEIGKDNLKDIWNNSSILQDFRKRQRISLAEIEECSDCGYLSLCDGGCPVIPYQESGSLEKPDRSRCCLTLQQQGVVNLI
jgi:SynChlorMet cassette radical SAM/SPASM protein ScmE